MRKVLSALCIIMLIAISLSAATPEYNAYLYTIAGNSFYSDLSGATHEFDGAGSGNYNSGDYNDADIAGILGVAAMDQNNSVFTNNKFTITYQLTSVVVGDDEWVYSSQISPAMQIPFGLDFVLRYNTWTNETGITSGVSHLGYGYNGETRIEADGLGTSFDVQTNSNWASFWFDIVLVVPSPDTWKTNFGNATDYQVDLTLTVTDVKGYLGKEGREFPLTLRGYYGNKSDDNSSGYVSFTVNSSLIAGSSIPLSSLNGGYFYIGKYSYDTSPIKSSSKDSGFKDVKDISSPLYMFVSSSPEITSNSNGKFYLKHEKASPNNNASPVNIPFSVGLQRSNGGQILWFDGDETSANAEGLQGQANYSSTRYGMEDIVILHDDGEILFKLGHDRETISNEDVLNDYVSGRYNSKIYIHLYSDI